MYYKITAYNGTTWFSETQQYLSDAVAQFCKETGLCEWDIRYVENLS